VNHDSSDRTRQEQQDNDTRKEGSSSFIHDIVEKIEEMRVESGTWKMTAIQNWCNTDEDARRVSA
jgi:hypothetical protein